MTRRKQFGRFKPWYDENHPKHPKQVERRKQLAESINKLRRSGPTIGELIEREKRLGDRE
jgi:hypothetical protein